MRLVKCSRFPIANLESKNDKLIKHERDTRAYREYYKLKKKSFEGTSSEDVSEMIATNRLKLNRWDWFSHFWPVFFLLLPPAFILFSGITMLLEKYKGVRSFGEMSFIFYIFIPLAILMYIVQNKRLYFTTITTALTYNEIEEAIDTTAKQCEWGLRERNNNFIQASHTGSFWTGSWGEQITMIIMEHKLLVNSICDPERRSSIASFGQNKKHIKSLVDNLTLIENRKSDHSTYHV